MNFTVFDKTQGPQHFEFLADAQVALASAQAAFLEREGYRFSVAIVVVDGNNTTWRLSEPFDQEDGDYRVFNHNTGGYEQFSKRSIANIRVDQLKVQLLVDAKLDKVYEYTPLPNTIRVAVPGEIL